MLTEISLFWLTSPGLPVFATLAVASTEEDTYGHVQQVLPATLEAIVRFRSSVASFESELVAQSVLLGRGQGAAVAEVQIRLGAPQAGAEPIIEETVSC